jgi:hypothetical protein
MCCTVLNKRHTVGALLTSHCIFVTLKSILMLLKATSFVRLWWQIISMALERKWGFTNKYNKVGTLWRSGLQRMAILQEKIALIRDDIKHLFSDFMASNAESILETMNIICFCMWRRTIFHRRSNLKMEAEGSSETLINIYQPTRHHITEG